MKQVKANKAVFNLDSYTINRFSFSNLEKEDTYLLGFIPSGQYSKEDRQFTVNLTLKVNKEINDVEIGDELLNVDMEAVFIFEEELDFSDVPEYFYRNSLAIIFPYLRAFVSTLTFQANIKPPVILPLLNLTQLEGEFKQNTKLVEKS